MRRTTLIGSLFLIAMLLSTLNSAGDYEPYLSHPSNIPFFDNYKTPTLAPGETGKLEFTVKNRYQEPIRNVTLVVEIYRWATLEESKPISKVSKGPKFTGSNERDSIIRDYSVSMEIDMLAVGLNHTVQLDIKARAESPDGVYFVRIRLEFDYANETGIDMRSRGYFSDQTWDQATRPDLTGEAGTINLTLLNTTAIVPDTSFSVKDPNPLWRTCALSFLIAGIVIFGSLAVVFYMIEEQGKEFPRFEKAIKKVKGLGRKRGKE